MQKSRETYHPAPSLASGILPFCKYPHCLKINDTETGEVSGRVPKVLRQKDDTERMEA